MQAARAVELCEMIIANRRLVSVRNPVTASGQGFGRLVR